MTSTKQKRTQSNRPVPNVDLSKYDDVRGIVHVAENRGDAIAYRGPNPPPSNSGEPSDTKKLYGQILNAKNGGHAIGFDQIPLPGKGEPQGEGSSQTSVVALDGRSTSRAFYSQTNSTTGTNLTPEMLEEFLSLPNNMQNFVEFLQTKKTPAVKNSSRSSMKNVPEDSQ